MKSAAYYVEAVKQLGLEHNAHFRAISGDGLIDYGEALNTRQIIGTYHASLQELKRQISVDIAELHEEYGQKMLVAQQSYNDSERAQVINQLRQEEQQATAAYEQIMQRIEFLQVGIPQNQHLIENHINAMEAEMNAVLDDLPEVASDLPPLDPTRDALERIVKHWHGLLQNIEDRTDDPQNPQQKAYDAGVQRALELAINDVKDVLALLP